MQKVKDISPVLGCDPEFFFKSKGAVIGAEKVFKVEGLDVAFSPMATCRELVKSPKFIIDGVQAELNPRPYTCRANLANEISACFKALDKELKARGDGIQADFSRAVEITKENLAELDEKSRKFGCAPSKSIYKKAGVKLDKIDCEEYRVRAAGGHIHIGHENNKEIKRALVDDYKKTVAMLDLLCGNTAVLIDRDEGNIERRKMYGKAGEFRLPPHGLEYRTLSNFWLTAYPLMSFAFGMARLAVQLMADKEHDMFFKEFTSKVKPKNIHAAINNNDFDQAMTNYKAIEPLMLEAVASNTDRYAVHNSNVIEFNHFVAKTKNKGLEYWFPQDPMEHWTTVKECHAGGFSDYLSTVVREDMKKEPKDAAVVGITVAA